MPDPQQFIKTPGQRGDVPDVLTVAEVALRLRCSKAHVCNAINGKVRGVTPLPAISMGRRKLVRQETLVAWLAQNDPSRGAGVIIPESCGIDAVSASKGKIDA
jgi:hypothetical protein